MLYECQNASAQLSRHIERKSQQLDIEKMFRIKDVLIVGIEDETDEIWN